MHHGLFDPRVEEPCGNPVSGGGNGWKAERAAVRDHADIEALRSRPVQAVRPAPCLQQAVDEFAGGTHAGVGKDEVKCVLRMEVVVEQNAEAFGLAKRSFEPSYPVQRIEIAAKDKVCAAHERLCLLRLFVVKDDAFHGRHPTVKCWKGIRKHHVGRHPVGHQRVPQPQRRADCIAVGRAVRHEYRTLSTFDQLQAPLRFRAVKHPGSVYVAHAAKVVRYIWDMGLLLLSLYLHACMALHDFHYSRTDVVYDATSRSWLVTLRVFTDDFEAALEQRAPAAGPMRLGDARQRTDAESVAAAWVAHEFAVSAGGKPLQLRWVGMDVAHDLTYVFLESAPGAGARAKELRIRNTAFFQQFEDQINEVNVRFGARDMKQALDRSRPEDRFSLQ